MWWGTHLAAAVDSPNLAGQASPPENSKFFHYYPCPLPCPPCLYTPLSSPTARDVPLPLSDTHRRPPPPPQYRRRSLGRGEWKHLMSGLCMHARLCVVITSHVVIISHEVRKRTRVVLQYSRQKRHGILERIRRSLGEEKRTAQSDPAVAWVSILNTH